MLTFNDVKESLEKEQIIYEGGSNAFIIPSKKNIKLIVTLENRTLFNEGLKLWLNNTLKKNFLRICFLFLYDLKLIYLFYNNKISINYKNNLISNLVPFDKINTFNIYVGLSKKSNASFTFQLISKKNIYYSRLPISKESNKFALNEFQNTQFLKLQQGTNINLNTPISCTQSISSCFYTYEMVGGNISQYDLNTKIIEILGILQSDKFVSFEKLIKENEILNIYSTLFSITTYSV